MGKKIFICKGKACKKADPDKTLKKHLKSIVGKKRIKKCKCLGICKSAFAIEYKGEIYSCPSKSDLEHVLASKKK